MINSYVMNLSKHKLLLIHILGILLLIIVSLSLGYLFRNKIGYLLSKVQTQESETIPDKGYVEIFSSNLETITFNELKTSHATQVDSIIQIPVETHLSIKNTSIVDGIKTLYLIECNSSIDNKDVDFQIGNSTIALERLIPINQEDSIILRYTMRDDMECPYNEDGIRTCPTPKEITVKNCYLLYSSETNLEERLRYITGGFPMEVDKYDNELLEFLRDTSKVVIEEIQINKTLDIIYLPY